MRASEIFFQSHPVFTHAEYAQSRNRKSPRTVDSLLRKHMQSGRIVRVRRGLYFSVALQGTKGAVDPYLVATKVTADAAISHHAALQFYGRTYSIWSQVTFLTRSHTRSFNFAAIEYIPVTPPSMVANLANMGGGMDILPYRGGQVRVCTCERAMVDVLHMPSLGGGWEEIWRSLEMIEFFDLDLVISYAILLNSATTVARVGFFLEQHQERLFVEHAHLARLAAHVPKSPHYFDTQRTAGRLISPWNLIVPEYILKQSWGEVL